MVSPNFTPEEWETLLKEQARPTSAGGARPSTLHAAATTMPAAPPEQGWGSKLAGGFRGAVSQPARDFSGNLINSALSGERAANALLPGNPGTAVAEAVGKVPYIGGVLRTGLDIATSPLTLATAGFGGAAAAALGTTSRVARLTAPLITPMLAGGGFGGRLAAEVAAGTAASIAGQAASKYVPEDSPGYIKAGVPLIAGLIAGIPAVSVAGRVRAGNSKEMINVLKGSMPGANLNMVKSNTTFVGDDALQEMLLKPTPEQSVHINNVAGRVNRTTGSLGTVKDVLNHPTDFRLDFDSLKSVDYLNDAVSAPLLRVPVPETFSNINQVLPRSGFKGLTDRAFARTVSRQSQNISTLYLQKAAQLLVGLADDISVDVKNQWVSRSILDPDTGKPAYISEVLSNPGKFQLTPNQVAKVVELNQEIITPIRNNSRSFGVEQSNVDVPNGQLFFPREVEGVWVKNAKTGTEEFVDFGELGKRVGTTTGGEKLAVLADTERTFITVREGIDAGYVYKRPEQVIEKYILDELNNASDMYLSTVLKNFGTLGKDLKGLPNKAVLSTIATGERTPPLTGMLFPPETAKLITEYFADGVTVRDQAGKALDFLSKPNRIISPIRAIGDMSNAFNQSLLYAANNPVQFVKNFGNALKSSFDEDAYRRFFVDPRTVESSPYITLLGEGFRDADFAFGEVVRKLPLTKNLQRNFEAMGNLNRREMFLDTVKIASKQAEKAGKTLSEMDKLNIGRAVDRLTGISANRAGSLERLGLFAPNFLRSLIETVGTAVTDGSIEGQLARQYVSRLVGTGMAISAMAALAQGRNPAEVLNPIDKVALKRGNLRINSNFGTIRVGGQDISMFGPYDSLARLSVVAGDAVLRTVGTQDPTQLGDFFGFLVRSKGSPIATTLANNLIFHSTFSQNSPLSLPGMLESTLPFSAASAMQDIMDGDPAVSISTGFAASFFGLKSNPVTPSEKRNLLAQEAYGVPYEELTGQERQELEQSTPQLTERLRTDTERRADAGDISAKARVARTQIDERRIAWERAAFEQAQSGGSRADLSKNLDKIQEDAAIRKQQSDASLGIVYKSGSGPDRALSDFYDTYNISEVTPGNVDWELRDELVSKIMGGIEAGVYGDPAIARRAIEERSTPIHAPEVEWYYDNKKIIADSGYYSTVDKVFNTKYLSRAQRVNAGISNFSDFNKVYNAAINSGDLAKARRLDVIKTAVSSDSSREKKQLIRRNADLRVALEENGKIKPNSLRQ